MNDTKTLDISEGGTVANILNAANCGMYDGFEKVVIRADMLTDIVKGQFHFANIVCDVRRAIGA